MAGAPSDAPTGPGAPLIELQCVSFRYPRAARPALEIPGRLTFSAGDRVLVIGHNGSGKSTLLSLLAGRRKPQRVGAPPPPENASISRALRTAAAGSTAGQESSPPSSKTESVAETIGAGAGPASIRVLGRDPFDDTSMAQEIALLGSPWPPEAYFATTVDRIATPAPVPARKAEIASALHLKLSRRVDEMSAGEKRRVQILHGMLWPATVYLLDECSTDIDVAERKTVLELVRRDCEARNGCCLYATHILDRVHDWATHVLLMKGGRVLACLRADEVPAAAAVPSAAPALAAVGQPLSALEQFALGFMSDNRLAGSSRATAFDTADLAAAEREEPVYFACEADRANPLACTERVIECTQLTFRDVFREASFHVFRGERVLLCGCNGSGKSTLLNMLGGKQFFANKNGALRALGIACYEDMRLNALIAYGGDWWTHVPGGEVHVREMLSITTARAERLRQLLAVDLDWDVRHISSGEQKRVQLLLHLLHDKPVILLDEATADLDVDQRHGLLRFLFAESACRGVTAVYATHIFGGLDGWATAVVVLDRERRGVHAVWRARDHDEIGVARVADELIKLKGLETF